MQHQGNSGRIIEDVHENKYRKDKNKTNTKRGRRKPLK